MYNAPLTTAMLINWWQLHNPLLCSWDQWGINTAPEAYNHHTPAVLNDKAICQIVESRQLHFILIFNHTHNQLCTIKVSQWGRIGKWSMDDFKLKKYIHNLSIHEQVYIILGHIQFNGHHFHNRPYRLDFCILNSSISNHSLILLFLRYHFLCFLSTQIYCFMTKHMCMCSLTLIATMSVVTFQPTRTSD